MNPKLGHTTRKSLSRPEEATPMPGPWLASSMALLYVELLGPDLFWEKYLEISGRSRVLSSQMIDPSGSMFSKGTVGLQIESEDLYKKLSAS
jgi:hypothetical protein